jgi:GAF domain-containing protein
MKLRGEIVGLLNVKTEEERNWTADEMDIIAAIMERAALSIESARLLQEAQKRAAKERVIGEISAKIGSSSNLESILQTAIQELGNTLPGTDIAIQFKNNQETE